MKFKLEIELGDDADAADIAPALRHAATTVWNHQKEIDFLRYGAACVFLRDTSGKPVGKWEVI